MRPHKPKKGPIVRAILDAQKAYFAMKKDGIPQAEIDAQIGQGLKAVLGREVPRYLYRHCNECDDRGWIEDALTDVRHIYGEDEPPHLSARRCTSCDYWERRWKEYLETVQRGTDNPHDQGSGLELAGKMKRKTRKW